MARFLDGPIELPEGVRPARREDVQPLSHTLARAFREDPVHRWMFPSERAWARNSHRSFAAFLRLGVDAGTALTSEGLEGAALWSSPFAVPPGPLRQLALGLRILPCFGLRIPRVVRSARRIDAAHPRRAHWYLIALGTDPPHQGKGIGSALVEPVMAHCDQEDLPAYLEASRLENIPYYQRFGFEVTEEIPLPARGPLLYAMLREPRGGGDG
jgi:GNAT superfamily N-acetyltransferase